jgi:capsular polysaccharide biosynthesis protein
MAEKTAALLGKGLTKEEVSADLSVSAQGESDIVSVAAIATSPALAAEIANTYTEQFVTEQQNSNRAYYASALALVNKQLAALSPKVSRNTILGAVLGLLADLRSVGLGVAFLLERLEIGGSGSGATEACRRVTPSRLPKNDGESIIVLPTKCMR